MAAKDEPVTSHDDPDNGLLRDPDDTELETLSLCDLPLYSDEYENDLLRADGGHRHGSSSPNIIDHDDPFEFSSEDLSGFCRMTCPAENIIFCGRLIPYDPPVMAATVGGYAEPRDKFGGGSHKAKKKKRRFFKWRLSLFRKQRNRSASYQRNLKFEDKTGSKNRHLPTGLECLPLGNYRYFPEKCTDKHGFLTERLTSRSGRVKCRWYLLMFRSARFPVGMELQDMKTRQSRRNLSPMFGSSDADAVAGDGKCNEKGNRNWGLWRLLRALSCISSQQYGSSAIRKTLQP